MSEDSPQPRSVNLEAVLALQDDERWHWTCPDENCWTDNSHPGWVSKAACANPVCNVVGLFGDPKR